MIKYADIYITNTQNNLLEKYRKFLLFWSIKKSFQNFWVSMWCTAYCALLTAVFYCAKSINVFRLIWMDAIVKKVYCISLFRHGTLTDLPSFISATMTTVLSFFIYFIFVFCPVDGSMAIFHFEIALIDRLLPKPIREEKYIALQENQSNL